MKTQFIVFGLILSTSVFAQQQRIVNMYKPIDIGFYQNLMNQTSSTITERTIYVKEMMSWIIDLKSSTTEAKINKELDEHYKKLDKCLNWDDIGELSITNLSNIELGIKKSIADYNARIASYNSELEKRNDPKMNYENGLAKLKNNDLDGAMIDFKNVEKYAPDFAGSYFYQGLIYYYKSQYESATILFSKAIERDQKNEDAYNLRGWSYNYSNRSMEAMSDFNKLISFNSQNADAYFGRGYAKDQLGDLMGARKDYEQVIKINPVHSMALNNMGWSYFESGDYKKALELLNKSIEADGSNYTAFDSRGETKLKLNDINGCIADCNKAIELNPSLSNSYLVRGNAYLKLNKKKNACEDWSKSGELGKSEAYELIRKYCNK